MDEAQVPQGVSLVRRSGHARTKLGVPFYRLLWPANASQSNSRPRSVSVRKSGSQTRQPMSHRRAGPPSTERLQQSHVCSCAIGLRSSRDRRIPDLGNSVLNSTTSRDDCSLADQDRWRELRRLVVRMCDALALVHLTVAGEPLTSVTARKLEGYVKSMRSSE